MPHFAWILTGAFLCLFLFACGSSIGDSCSIASDCSPYGDRLCDTTSPGGYCTVAGCDWDTCPDDAVCVRFFNGSIGNRSCNQSTEDKEQGTNDCSPHELCTINETCAPRSAETRYCMQGCSSSDDCRSKYECRDVELMKNHGGEPVYKPNTTPTSVPRYCGPAPL